MLDIKSIAALISVRDFLSALVENMRIKLSREEVKNIQNKVAAMDKAILEQGLKFDVAELNIPTVVSKQYTFQSTEDVEDVVRNFPPVAAGVSGVCGPFPGLEPTGAWGGGATGISDPPLDATNAEWPDTAFGIKNTHKNKKKK
jgi:hypothetical protein